MDQSVNRLACICARRHLAGRRPLRVMGGKKRSARWSAGGWAERPILLRTRHRPGPIRMARVRHRKPRSRLLQMKTACPCNHSIWHIAGSIAPASPIQPCAKSRPLRSRETKPDVVTPVVGDPSHPSGGPHETRIRAHRPTAGRAARAHQALLLIGIVLQLFGVWPHEVAAPLHDVSTHIMQAQAIGRKAAHG